jgi:outer membrane protein TolC
MQLPFPKRTTTPSILAPAFRRHTTLCLLTGSMLWTGLMLGAEPSTQQAKEVSLRECIETALVRNRTLQIERLTPQVARLALEGAYNYYDPVLFTQVQREHDADTGGFDPADFSRDAIYSAKSEVARGTLSGFLPTGLSYSLWGGYAHSEGTRNLLNFDSYKVVAGISARQPLLRDFWTDQGRTLIQVNKRLLKISELGVEYLVMDTINQVQQAYYELAFTIENLGARSRLLAAKEATLKAVRRQVEVGSLTALEEQLALAQVSRVQAELVAASNTVVQAENVLRTLLGYTISNWTEGPLVPTEPLSVVPQPLQLAASWERGLETRPDLAQMRQEVERAGIVLRFHRNQLFPNLDIVAGYGRRGANAVQTIPPAPASASLGAAFDQIGDNAAPNDMVGIVFSTPLSRVRERASYRAGKELKEQSLLRLQQKEELILREISDALNNASSARDRARATRLAKEYAEAALKAEERKLAGGTSSLFFVYQLQSDLSDAESAELRARADYNKALSQLRFAEGSLLDQHGLSVSLK